MYTSIKQFEGSGTKKIEKVIENFIKTPTDMASFVCGILDQVIELGLSIIKETLEDCDQMLRDSGKRKLDWMIIKRVYMGSYPMRKREVYYRVMGFYLVTGNCPDFQANCRWLFFLGCVILLPDRVIVGEER